MARKRQIILLLLIAQEDAIVQRTAYSIHDDDRNPARWNPTPLQRGGRFLVLTAGVKPDARATSSDPHHVEESLPASTQHAQDDSWSVAFSILSSISSISPSLFSILHLDLNGSRVDSTSPLPTLSHLVSHANCHCPRSEIPGRCHLCHLKNDIH